MGAMTMPPSDAVLDLIAETLELDRTLLTRDLTIEEIGMDSLDVLKLTYAIEQTYKINLSAYSYGDISSIARLLDILETELQRQAPK